MVETKYPSNTLGHDSYIYAGHCVEYRRSPGICVVNNSTHHRSVSYYLNGRHRSYSVGVRFQVSQGTTCVSYLRHTPPTHLPTHLTYPPSYKLI